MNAWISSQVEHLKELEGRAVTGWSGTEMAVREGSHEAAPSWCDQSVPYLQMERLLLSLHDGALASISTYQNDDTWGLFRPEPPVPLLGGSQEPNSIFRNRDLPELPVGRIDRVAINLVEGDIGKVDLHVAGRVVELRAGEVHEISNGQLQVVFMDESILVQVDGQHPSAHGGPNHAVNRSGRQGVF